MKKLSYLLMVLSISWIGMGWATAGPEYEGDTW